MCIRDSPGTDRDGACAGSAGRGAAGCGSTNDASRDLGRRPGARRKVLRRTRQLEHAAFRNNLGENNADRASHKTGRLQLSERQSGPIRAWSATLGDNSRGQPKPCRLPLRFVPYLPACPCPGNSHPCPKPWGTPVRSSTGPPSPGLRTAACDFASPCSAVGREGEPVGAAKLC